MATEPGAGILKAISELKMELSGFNDGLKQELSQLGQEINGKLDKISSEVQSLNERVEEVEGRVEKVERWAEAVTEELCASLAREKALMSLLDENNQRSRRCNIRIFNCGEHEEKDVPMPVFVEKLLRSKLQLPETLELKIQRAHRSKPQRPPPDKAPRSIVVNFLEFTTKELVLKQAWEQSKKEKIQLGDNILYFDHDYSPEVLKKRKAYSWIKKALKTDGIRFQTPFTRMKIHWEDGVKTYNSATEAGDDLRKRGFSMEEAPPAGEEGDLSLRLRKLLGDWQKVPGRRAAEAAERTKDKLQSFQRGRARPTPRKKSNQREAIDNN